MKKLTELAERLNELHGDNDRFDERCELSDRFDEMLNERYREQLDKARNDSEVRYWRVRQEIERMCLIQTNSRFLVPKDPLDYQRDNSGENSSGVAHIVYDWRKGEPYREVCRNVDQDGLMALLASDAARYEAQHPDFFEYWDRRPVLGAD